MVSQQSGVVCAHSEHVDQQKSEWWRPRRRARGLLYLTVVLGGSVISSLVNATPFAYVTNDIGNSVSVIDTATNTVVATIPAGFRPRDIAITPDGSQAYVANLSNPGTVSIINTTTNSVVATISTGLGIEPNGVAIANPTGAFAYVTNFRSNTVSVIDTAIRTVVATIAVGTEPTGVAVTPDGAFTYVTNLSTSSSVGSVSVIDNVARSVIATVAVGSWPRDLAISPNGAFVYVVNQVVNTVSVIATATNTVIATVSLSPASAPVGVAFTADGAFAYVENNGTGSISIINTGTHTVVQTVPAGATPVLLAFTPDGHYGYVANSSTNTVSVIDTTTKLITATIGVGTRPGSVAIAPSSQPPVCSAAQANPAAIWAPNHRFVPIAILGVTDPENDPVTLTVIGVRQDEPVLTPGSDTTSPDAVIQAGSAAVRAERLSTGNGRVYHLAFTATDGHGGTCTGDVTVGVPHSMGKGVIAIDGGPAYDSTIP